MNKSLHTRIMRRVYYAYALRLAGTPGLLQGFLMLSGMIGLTYFVSLGNVIYNLKQIPVGQLHYFFYNAVTNTEAWTYLLVGVLIYSALSLRVTISPRRKAMQWANG